MLDEKSALTQPPEVEFFRAVGRGEQIPTLEVHEKLLRLRSRLPRPFNAIDAAHSRPAASCHDESVTTCGIAGLCGVRPAARIPAKSAARDNDRADAGTTRADDDTARRSSKRQRAHGSRIARQRPPARVCVAASRCGE